jgi:hypothetical protein
MTVIPETLCEHHISYLRFYCRCYNGSQEQRIDKWTESTMVKIKSTNNDLQNITHKTKNGKYKPNKLTRVNTSCSCSTSGTCPVLLLRLKITKSQN